MDTTKHSTPPARHLTARELEGGVQLPRELLRADLQLAWHAAKQDVQQNSGLHFTNPWPKRLEELESLERTAASDDQAAAAAFARLKELQFLERSAAAEDRAAEAARAYETALRNVVAETYVYGADDGSVRKTDERATILPRRPVDAEPLHVDELEEPSFSAGDHPGHSGGSDTGVQFSPPAPAFRGAASYGFEASEDRWARELGRANAERVRLLSLLELERTRRQESQRLLAAEREGLAKLEKAEGLQQRASAARLRATVDASRSEIRELEERLAYAESVGEERRQECDRVRGEAAALRRTIGKLEAKQRADAKLAEEHTEELSKCHARLEGVPRDAYRRALERARRGGTKGTRRRGGALPPSPSRPSAAAHRVLACGLPLPFLSLSPPSVPAARARACLLAVRTPAEMSASLAQARTAHERDSAAHVRETAAALEAALRDKTAAVEKVRSELTEELSRTKAEMGAGVSELRNALEKITAQNVSVRRRALTPPSAAALPPRTLSPSPSLPFPLSPSCLPPRSAASESVRPRAQQARPRGTLLTHTRRALVVRSRPSDVRIRQAAERAGLVDRLLESEQSVTSLRQRLRAYTGGTTSRRDPGAASRREAAADKASVSLRGSSQSSSGRKQLFQGSAQAASPLSGHRIASHAGEAESPL